MVRHLFVSCVLAGWATAHLDPYEYLLHNRDMGSALLKRDDESFRTTALVRRGKKKSKDRGSDSAQKSPDSAQVRLSSQPKDRPALPSSRASSQPKDRPALPSPRASSSQPMSGAASSNSQASSSKTAATSEARYLDSVAKEVMKAAEIAARKPERMHFPDFSGTLKPGHYRSEADKARQEARGHMAEAKLHHAAAGHRPDAMKQWETSTNKAIEATFESATQSVMDATKAYAKAKPGTQDIAVADKHQQLGSMRFAKWAALRQKVTTNDAVTAANAGAQTHLAVARGRGIRSPSASEAKAQAKLLATEAEQEVRKYHSMHENSAKLKTETREQYPHDVSSDDELMQFPGFEGPQNKPSPSKSASRRSG